MALRIPYHCIAPTLSNPTEPYFSHELGESTARTDEPSLHPLFTKQIFDNTADNAIMGPRVVTAPIEWRFFSLDYTIGTGLWYRFAWTRHPPTGQWRVQVKEIVRSRVVACEAGPRCAVCCGLQFGCLIELSTRAGDIVGVIPLNVGEPFRVLAYKMLLSTAPPMFQLPPVAFSDGAHQQEMQELSFRDASSGINTSLLVGYCEGPVNPNPNRKALQMLICYEPSRVDRRDHNILESLLRLTSGYGNIPPTLELFYGGYSGSAPEDIALEIPALKFAIQHLIYERYELTPFTMPTMPLRHGWAS